MRDIDEAQASVVRRIFAEYAAGRSPRAIAETLNGEGIPSPSGKMWRANTINGNRERGNGVLHNERYTGIISYNRQSFVRDPASRKRVARRNLRDQWITREAPALRIIDEQSWTAAQQRLEHGQALSPARQRRPKRLLSGLVKCGTCGGTFAIISRDRWGCSTARETGTCNNGRSIVDAQLETRNLGALSERMSEPYAVAAYVEEYRRAFTPQQKDRHKARRGL